MSFLFTLLPIFGLSCLWLVLSGHYTPVLLILGGLSVLTASSLGTRLAPAAIPHIPHPHKMIIYWLWLAKEITKANFAVLAAILRPVPDIQPEIIKIHSRCQSPFARTVLANSITLTPGTVTLSVSGSEFLIHALLHSMTHPESFAEMDFRVCQAFDPPS